MAKGTQRAFGGHIRPGSVPFDALVENLAQQESAAGTQTVQGPAAKPASNWLRYSNQNATRNQPISPSLQRDLAFLGEMGIEMEVYSGGQPARGTSSRRVGSDRHDHGNSADVLFYKDGRRLDWANEADVPTYQEIVRRARANGVTGFGAGPGYMQQGAMHIGYGAPGVWGAGGRGQNAPTWLKDAFNGPAAGAKQTTNSAPMVNQASSAADQALNPKQTEKAAQAPQASATAATALQQRQGQDALASFIQWGNDVRKQTGAGNYGVGAPTALGSMGGHQQSRGGGVIQSSMAAVRSLDTY